MERTSFLRLGKSDFWKGLVVAVLTAGVTGLSTAITNATDFASFNWQSVVLAAAGGFVGYILKNLLTNSDGEILKTEKK